MGSVGNKQVVTSESIVRAQRFAEGFKGSAIDIDNHIIQIPFSSNTKESDLFGPLGTGTDFKNRGFDVSFEKRDVEYMTQGSWISRRGFERSNGKKAYLRNRLVMTLKW